MTSAPTDAGFAVPAVEPPGSRHLRRQGERAPLPQLRKRITVRAVGYGRFGTGDQVRDGRMGRQMPAAAARSSLIPVRISVARSRAVASSLASATGTTTSR